MLRISSKGCLDGAAVYIRFQGKVPNLGTASRLGIFQLAFELRDRFDTPDYVHAELQRNLSWLRANLKSPDVLNKDGNYRAICWFKSGAKEPLDRIWAIKAILEDSGYPIDVVKTKSPGSVIYEDNWQVVAKPPRRQHRRRTLPDADILPTPMAMPLPTTGSR